MKQAQRLRILASFLEAHSLEDIAGVTTSATAGYVTIPYWDQCTAAQRRTVKRVFGPLVVKGGDAWRYLEGSYTTEEELNVKCEIFGAFKCEVVRTLEQEVELSETSIDAKIKEIERLQHEVATGIKIEMKHEYNCIQTLPHNDEASK